MKYYIHPKRKKTLIQRKDGRTYTKNWVYFRSILRIENDEKSWAASEAGSSVTNAITKERIQGIPSTSNTISTV